ncbi:MAG TPA: YdcF family protein [Candidatus Sulfotelmatobacter sp.]|nr:YdcF family protein [Candidatus Sulfotelmatobacter sp.]
MAIAIVILAIGCLLVWGDALLIAREAAPPHAEALVVLQGSIVGEKSRIAGAVELLQRETASHLLLSVPKESFWGQSIPPVAHAYLERNYGSDVASRVVFCETDASVNSTQQEAQALDGCIREQHWQSVVIVTSNYHTRRARLLWRRTTHNEPNLHLSVYGVADPEYQLPWWRHRQAAKIWVMEFLKLVWAVFA